MMLPDGIPTNASECGGESGDSGCGADAVIAVEVASLRIRPPDPRFGMLAPIPTEVSIETGGKTLVTSAERTVTLTNPDDPTTVETLTDTVTLNGRVFETLFDATGAVPTLTRTTNAGRVTTTELDTEGRPTRVEVVGSLGLAPTTMTYYDASTPELKGLLRTMTQGSGTEARAYEFFYDAAGNLESVQAPLTNVVSFTYDGATRVTGKTFPDGEEVRFFYDDSGNLETLAQPGSDLFVAPDGVHLFDSGPIDLLDTYTAPDIGLVSHETTYKYTVDRELDLVTRPDGLTVDPMYDAAGRLSQLVVPSGSVDYGYFPNNDPSSPGKLQSVSSTLDGVDLAFAYDGSLLTEASWDGAISGGLFLDYDDDLRIVSDTVAGSSVDYVYGDDDGLLTEAGALSLTLDGDTALLTGMAIGGLAETITYNQFAEPVSYIVDDGGSTVYQLELAYDALGRVAYKTETTSSATAGYEYRYDTAGRLAKIRKGTDDCSVIACDVVAKYNYDANGNRVAATEGAVSLAATYDAQDRLLTRGLTSYAYTDAGELAAKSVGADTTTYSYDVLGNLRHVQLPAGTTIDYVIDGLNRRVGKKIGGTLARGWLYGGAPGPIAELDSDGSTLVARFVYGTRGHVPDYMVKGGSTYRFVTDQLGSVRLVVDVDSGVIAQRIEYDAWGVVLSDTNPGFQPFGFAGGLYDPDTRLVRFGARDYDAEAGRWTAKDPIGFGGGDTNLYEYVLSDPVNAADPLGLVGSLIEGWLAGDFAKSLIDTGVANLQTGNIPCALLNFRMAVDVATAPLVGAGELAASLRAPSAARAGVPALRRALSGLQPKDAQIVQRAAELARSGQTPLSALARATGEVIPHGQVHLLGELQGARIFGSAITRTGILTTAEGTFLVRAPLTGPTTILGTFP